jgi:hypothetical protein
LVDKIIKNHSGNVSLADNYTTQGGKLMNWITSNFPEVARLPLPPGCKSWNHIAIIKEKKDQEALKSSPGMEK